MPDVMEGHRSCSTANNAYPMTYTSSPKYKINNRVNTYPMTDFQS